MASFSIDDVRETFTSDMTQFVLQIEGAGSTLLAAQALTSSVPLNAQSVPLFESIGNSSHGIAGSSSLVNARSLVTLSRLLERVSRSGQSALQVAEQEVARARMMATLCVEGASKMKELLGLELSGRGDEANDKALAWLQAAVATAGELPTSEDAVAEPAADRPESLRSFRFEDDAYRSSPSGAPGPVEAELVDIFYQEARETLGGLEVHLAGLAARPDDLATGAQVERIFHMLKGAAATVGLLAVSALAAELQEHVETVIEGGNPFTLAQLGELVRSTNRLMRTVGLPEVGLNLAHLDAPASAEARRFFLEEAEQISDEASRLLREGQAEGAATAPESRTRLAELFHRLKGSALILGDEAVAAEAAKLQRLAEADPGTQAPDDGALQKGLAGIRALLSRSGSPERRAAAQRENDPEAPLPPVRSPVTLVPEPEMLEAFHQECRELLEGLEKELLGLEESAQPKAVLEQVMRLVHTLKGAVNTVGLVPTGAVLHLVEDLLENLVEAPIVPSLRNVATLLFSVNAEVRRNLQQSAAGYVETSPEQLARSITGLLNGRFLPVAAAPSSASPDSRTGSEAPSQSGGSRGDTDERMDRRYLRVALDRLDALMDLAGELVVGRSRLTSRLGVLRGLQRELDRRRFHLNQKVESFREQYDFHNLDGRKVAAPSDPAPPTVGMRKEVWSGFSDLELDRYEDVHIFSRSLAEITNDFAELDAQMLRSFTGFNEDSEHLSAIVSSIQFEVTRARMVPLETLFSRLRLPIRDAATRQEREVKVETQGDEVHLDKSIVDALLQPMLHLVRNAVAHGIEAPLERERRQKPRGGTVTLGARQESGQIVVEIQDDGAGLNLPALHARGVELGLIPATLTMDDPAVRDLVFAKGLSTQGTVSTLSGRGVGCDVVRRAVERLNGDIRVESRPGRGTTFIINLPLTLAITKSLLVQQGGTTYAIPLFFAERIVDPEDNMLVDSFGVARLRLDGGTLVVRRLGSLLGAAAEAPNNHQGPIILLRLGDQRLALQVDALVTQEEVVVKNLGELLTGHPLFAGMTVRGNGELVLILDIPGVISASIGEVRAEFTPARLLKQAAVDPLQLGGGKEPRVRVLFVDDSLSVRKVAESTFKKMGMDVTTAVDGQDGLAKLREGMFDIVFTDLEMPRMHGYELIREVRFVPAYQDLPLVVVSSRSGAKHQDQARSLGATEYITKPFNEQVLRATVTKLCPHLFEPRGPVPAVEGRPRSGLRGPSA